MVTLNGEEIQNAEGKSLLQLVEEKNFNLDRIVLEVNEEIISKKDWSSFIVKNQCAIEVITFVGGG